jgi:hypothetical protein
MSCRDRSHPGVRGLGAPPLLRLSRLLRPRYAFATAAVVRTRYSFGARATVRRSRYRIGEEQSPAAVAAAVANRSRRPAAAHDCSPSRGITPRITVALLRLGEGRSEQRARVRQVRTRAFCESTSRPGLRLLQFGGVRRRRVLPRDCDRLGGRAGTIAFMPTRSRRPGRPHECSPSKPIVPSRPSSMPSSSPTAVVAVC